MSGHRIIIAPDSFKGSISALDAAKALAFGLKDALPNAEIICLPMADGGEGTREIIASQHNANQRIVAATNPLGRVIDVPVSLIDDAATAVIELAEVSGYQLLADDERNALKTSTFGLGTVIRTAIESGVDKILLCLGGSATVDGGAGMMQALGLRLFDCKGQQLPDAIGGGQLIDVDRFMWHGPPDHLENVSFEILCDVLNPAIGPNGAAHVFGPQKGADEAGVNRLELGMTQWIDRLETMTGIGVKHQPGSGAAGGVAVPLISFCRAELIPGVDYVAQLVRLNEHATDADLIITGEGQLDRQSMMGKVVGSVARAAELAHVPCVAVVGRLGSGHEPAAEKLDRIFTLDCDFKQTAERMRQVGEIIAAECL